MLFVHAHARYYHAAVGSLAHVLDRQQIDLRGRQCFQVLQQVCKPLCSCLLLEISYFIAIFALRVGGCEGSNVICSYKTYLSIFLNNERLLFDIFHEVLPVLSEVYEQYLILPMLHGR